jgi:hypothetical protein
MGRVLRLPQLRCTIAVAIAVRAGYILRVLTPQQLV